MTWLSFALLMFISLSSGAYGICSKEFPEIANDDLRCIQTDDDRNATCALEQDITLRVVDSEAGTLSVEFNLAPYSCNWTMYELTLYIEESKMDQESCKNLKFVEDIHSKRILSVSRNLDIHSERRLRTSRNSGKEEYCKEREMVTFHNVYTGCYVLQLITDKNETFVPPKFIVTNHTKTTLIDKIPAISSKYLSTLGELEFIYSNVNSLNVTRMDVHTRVCQSHPCTCEKGAIQHSWGIAFSREGNFMCKAKNNKTFDASTECRFDKNGDRMMCSIKNVTPGIYCVLLQLYDDRCNSYTVWHRGAESMCLYNTNPINVTGVLELANTTAKTPESSSLWFAVIISLVAVLCILSIGVLLYLYLRGRPMPPLVFHSNKQTLVQQNSSIVLLYALDCKPFMSLMSVFRDILKEITKCEVYDCFDPEYAEEIALNKTDWLRRQMASSKIVLVENRCAVLHQRELLKQKKLTYKDTVSTFVDDLFIYGLKMLTDDCFGKSMYEKVLVVRIDGFTEPKDVLSHVAPLTRYTIPQNMEQLLLSLYQLKSQQNEREVTSLYLTSSQSEYEMDSRMLKFIECLKNLENYKTEKPEYLNNMLTKETEPTIMIV